MTKTLRIVLLVAAVLAATGYAAGGTQPVRDWHPVFGPVLGSLGFPGHNGQPHEHPVSDGAFVDGGPVTSCWNYDFWQFELDCDGPAHYKAFADGGKIGAYKGDPTPVVFPLPLRAKACVTTADGREVCVSDWVNDGKTVWRDTGGRIVEHRLAIACPGPRFELPCRSRD
jgi:hypothetical protein